MGTIKIVEFILSILCILGTMYFFKLYRGLKTKINNQETQLGELRERLSFTNQSLLELTASFNNTKTTLNEDIDTLTTCLNDTTASLQDNITTLNTWKITFTSNVNNTITAFFEKANTIIESLEDSLSLRSVEIDKKLDLLQSRLLASIQVDFG